MAETTNFAQGATVSLRYFLEEFFADNGIEAYYQFAPDCTTTPYVVWELRLIQGLIDNVNSAKKYILEINAYHKSSALELDNLLDFLDGALDGATSNNGCFFVSIDNAFSRFAIEEGKEIKHMRTSYEVKYFTWSD